MAKLTGVKTIDMVGGEITKVEYNGELYAKTDDSVKGGDLFQLRKGHCVIDGEVDAFYTTKQYGGHSVIIPTTFGGNATVVQSKGSGVAYRKESTKAPSQTHSLESRVETLETKVATLEKGEEVGDGEYRLVTDRKPRVGDFVKYNSDNDDDDITVGVYYKIIGLDWDDEPEFIDDIGDRTYAADYENWDLYEKVGAEDESIALRVGDYAKVVDDYGNSSHRVEIGTIVRIKETNSDFSDQYPIEAEYISGEDTGSLFHESDLVKATDEEVANAKKEQAEAKAKARWAAIGRKPNEFKKGDIVCILKDNANGSNHKSGDIGVVDSKPNIEFRVRTPRINAVNFVRPQDVELITPVESRFDR